MWKAFLFLVCVAGYMAIVSCGDETNPTGETKPIEETEPDGTSSDGCRRCGCYPPICPKNEVYYNCSGGCVPRRCSELGFPLNCDKKCTPGCVCKEGYVRADNGTCIPIKECPSCGGDKNAQQGCGNICGRTCSTYNKPPGPCPRFCIYNGCDCRKGYVFDNNTKVCVKPENCTPICKNNEEYSRCVNGGTRNCSQIGKPVPCINPKCCIKGCVCVKGYLRASNGTCVPKDQCKTYPPICPKNEVYYNCSGGCVPRRCSEIGFLLNCDKKCTPGCVCKDGYVRADNGTCIPIPECPSCGGDKNAQQGCGINCGRFCSTYKNPPKSCPPGCIFNGCDCRKGYVYDSIKKRCVKPEDCTPICKVNEKYSSCINGGCEARNCSQIGKPVPCIHPKYCIKGCVCVKGYLRASNGTCVPKDQCKTYPPICPKNEVYYNCSGGCVPRRCSEIGFLLNCDKKCTPGCVCKDGYVRADNGTCIPIPECPSCGGDKNAQQGCGINCGRFCSTYKNPPKSCPPGCIFNGCDCRKGYVYDSIKKRCVKPEDCTPICKVNEKYSSCVNGGCEARNCSQIGKPVPCIHPKYCIKGCVCVKGYLRASNGTCVPKDQCKTHPPICPKNEVYYNCSGGCVPRRCSEIGFLLNCDKKCTPGCVCKDGYVRADNGTCIPIPECPSCGGDKNAQQGCGINCGRFCSTYKKPPKSCPPGCIFNGCDCRKGYVYDSIKKRCVKPEDCTPICKVNEKYSSCVNGGCEARNCSQIGKPVPCIHPKYCIKGCVCVKGYLRASNGTCVPKDQCKTYPPICPKNEVYYNCSGGCVPRRCSEIGFLLNCDKKCTPGCVCKDGYVRADNGTCIPIPKCPSCGGDKNAQQGCGINCGRFCSTYKNPPKSCPPGCIFNGCDCRKGYVYDSIKKRCVKPEDCTPICKVNEKYSSCINGGCEARNCSQIGKPVPCIHPKYCIKGCVCVKGYLRASNGTCVPKDQCKTHPPICPKNEVYYNCSGGCVPRRCSELGFPLKCDKKCTPGCVCKDGYVRADNGTCIPIKECPSCGGDKNAQQGCGINCGRTCSTYKNPPKPCPPGCIFNGCDCRKGYVYDNIKKVCVKPEDCTPICKVNEQYSSCVNGGCDARNCSQIGKPLPCKKIDPKYCIKGCICVKGYLRAKNGTCVPKDQCKTYPPICPKNEVYYNCSGGCIPRRCSELGFPLKCDKKCTPGCVCKDGYVRADNGTCIPIKECPSCGGDKNAQHGCGINCGRTCSTYKNPPKPCPPGCIFNGCDCRKGYVYDNIKKVCVKPEDCTPICKVNEKYSSCVNGGCEARNCSQIGKPVPCIHPKYCIKGCVCVKGYLRASNGTCVPKDQCKTHPPICPKNEVYYNCSGGCVPRRCSELGFPLKCDKKCTPGCVCKDGYVRADNGTCIPIKECPSCGGDKNAQQGCGINCGRTCSTYKNPPKPCPPGCIFNGCDCRKGYVYDNIKKLCVKPEDCTPICKVNEKYSSCVNGGCEARNCSQIGKPVPCIHPKYCIKGCVCVKGYLRASNGTCVPKDQCKTHPPICPKNEVYYNCSGGCVPRRCSELGFPHKCDKKCTPGCVCKDGYVRADNGTCIPIKECPSKKCGKNEHWEECYYSCSGNQTCGDIGKKHYCPAKQKCCRGCRCDKGYWRNADNVCIPENQCPHPPICPKNEVYYNCSGGCIPRRCSELGFPHKCDKKCTPGCVCKDGYVRADNGTCIPIKECPSKKCGKNEHWEECYYSCSGNQTCGDIGKKHYCPAKQKCCRGCRCDKGYWRNADNVCIPENQCPHPPICPKNEVYYNCSGGCIPRRCSELGFPHKCDKKCTPGCVCKDGYVRADNGTCIPIKECPSKKCGKNEHWEECYYSCSGNQTCGDIGKKHYCPAKQKCCRGCRCDKGYWRNADNVCIPENQCPHPPICPKNEVYYNCSGGCVPRRCSELGFPHKCDKKCTPGCVCKDGYVRADNGTCIPIKECPSKKCGKNEHWEECYYSCSGNQTCGDIGKKHYCPAKQKCCRGCRCDKGYWRNADNVCIPENQCPKPCGKNEYWEPCIPGCGNQSCTEVGRPPQSCPGQIVGHCPKGSGCRCKPKYYRNSHGVCVPESECPKPKCPSGEDWNWCPTVKCDGDYCPKTKDSPQTCPVGIVCDKPRCVCESNRKRDWKTGKCIRIQDCPKFKCGYNEEYQACPPPCPGEKCSDYIHGPGRCPLIKYICRPQCRCVKGYYRNAHGTCIPACDCTVKGKNMHTFLDGISME